LVEYGRTGLLVGQRNPAELAHALETLLVNENLRKEFGVTATRRIEAFDLPRVAGRFLETLRARNRGATGRASASSPGARARTVKITRSMSPSAGRSTRTPAWSSTSVSSSASWAT